MVLQVLTHRQVRYNVDAQLLQLCSRADARQQQQPRRVDGTGTQENFAPSRHHLAHKAGHTGASSLAAQLGHRGVIKGGDVPAPAVGASTLYRCCHGDTCMGESKGAGNTTTNGAKSEHA